MKSRQQGHKRRQESISHKAQDRRRETGRARCKIKGTGNKIPAEGLGARSRRSPGSIPGKEERNGRKEDIKKAPAVCYDCRGSAKKNGDYLLSHCYAVPSA